MGLHEFWKKELADVYLEAIKPVMKSENQAQKQAALNTLYLCLDTALKLLHPTMPYLTEELYQRLPHTEALRSDSISISAFPQHQTLDYDWNQVDVNFMKLYSTVRALRSQLAAYKVQGNVKPTVVIQASTPELNTMFKQEIAVVTSLVKAGETLVIGHDEVAPQGCLKGFVTDEIAIYVKVVGLIDIKVEVDRI